MKRGRMRRRNTGRSLLVIWIIVMLVFMSIDGAGIRSAAALADSNDAPDDGGFLVHDTFESDAVGEIPLGYTATSASDAGALVSDTQAHEGTQSVKVYDQSATKLAEMVKTFPAQSSVTLDFALYPVSVADAAGAIQFSLLGEGTDVYSSVFHMKVSADGSLSYYNGSAWMPVSGPDTVVFNAWNAIRVVANDTENAEIYVNDLFVGTANHFANASSLGGIRFATGGSNQLGDEFFVDDVRVVGSEEEALDMIVNDTFESDTVGEIPAGYIVTKSGTDAEALVSDAQAYDGSSRSLRVYDNDTGTDTSIVKPFLLPQSSVILEFVLYPVAVGADQGAIQFGILGEGTDVYSSVFHMKVSDNRSLAYYDGSAWKDVGDADTVAFNAWNVIRIEAHNTTDADIYVNDVLVGTAENFANAETLGGIRFATGGTRQTGDDFYVDNVSVKGDNAEGELEVFNLPINEAFDSDPVGEAPAGYLIMKSDANAEAVVSDEQAYDSSHSLWVNGRVELVKFFTPESSTKMEFMIYPIEANSGISFGFGNGINIKLGPDGDLHYKRGSGWYIISDPGNVKFNTWNKITIDAPSTNFARVYINDEYAGIAPGDLKVNAFNRIHFSTANASKDAEFYVDDISVDHGTPELEAPAYTAAEITPHSVISLDSTIGYLNNDIAPASGSIQNWGDTRSFEFDYERRSIGIDLGESKKVNAIKLWDSDKMSRLNQNHYSLYYSNDNETYTRIPGALLNTAIDDERDRLVNYLEFSGVTARYLKINTSLTDTNSTFLLNDLQNDVQVFQYPDKEYEIPTTSGYLHSDPTPLSGGLSNWFSYASVAVNEQDRSVGVDLGIKVPVDAIELWGAENSTTISKNNLSLYKSDDNENYSEISEWTYSTSNENGKIKIRLSFPSTTTRYLKVHNNLNNDSATFVLVNMQDDIKAFSSVEVAGNFQRFPDGRGSEGGFINLNDGTLAMAVDHFVDGSADTSQSELGWYKSTDGGESWRDIETLLENEGVRNTMHPALIRLKNGDLGMAYQVQDGDENTQIYFRISKDEGKSWGERTLITSATEKGYNIMPSGNKILRFPSGRIIVPVAFSPNLSGAFDDRMYAQVWYSDDEGAMWSRSSGIYLPNGALEPVVTRLNDGNLLMTLRTRREGKMYKSYSTDDGVTWSKPEEMGLDSPSSANTVQVIPATGDVLLVWNNVYSTSNNPREPLTMAISRDNGTTWHMIQNLFEGAYSTWPQIAFYGRKVFFGFGNGPNVESAVRVVDIDTLYHSVEGREVSIATIQQFINTYEENNQLKGPIVHQLENRLAQAKHHYEKGSITQATKHMQDFVKHLKNKGLQKFIDQEAKAVLETEANHLINSWSE